MSDESKAPSKRLDEQMEYSIKLQRLLESLKREGTPYPELHHHQMVIAVKERIAALTQEKDRALAANELDRRRLHEIVTAIEAEITGRMWLLEGRGSYEWDDDKYRQEFGWAVHAIQEKLELLRRISSSLKDCPADEKGVDKVRRLEGLEQENAQLRAALEKMKQPVSNTRKKCSPHEHQIVQCPLGEYCAVEGCRYVDGIDLDAAAAEKENGND